MTIPSSWRPTASLSTLQARADLYRYIRQFFHERDILEVETPILSLAATVDPHIASLSTQVMEQRYYLQTSPEFFLKRLLAAHRSSSIYSLGKVFRDGERGRKHHPEFTMLEWYRVGWDEQQLIQEVFALLQPLFPPQATVVTTYKDLFQQHLGFDPHSASVSQLKTYADELVNYEFDLSQCEESDRNLWLDLLMTHCVEPKLPDQIIAVCDYPASQAALARIDENDAGQAIARRFEIYINRIELANGYYELTDVEEQRRRFASDMAYRQQQSLSLVPHDEKLLSALAFGMPNCAGVALGIDRLLMLMLKLQKLEETLSFAD